jgi:pimeloyl-ACP methyl ester carboxylesterase
MPTLPVNDIHMYYEIHGQGEPLVLISGLSGDISQIRPLITWFAQTHQVLAFDNRGAGRTDKPDAPYSIEMMAADTVGLMYALHITPAHVLGISMGGRIALQLTLEHPELVRKLVLVSTAARTVQSLFRRRRLRLLDAVFSANMFQRAYPQPHYAFLRQLEASSNYNCVQRLTEIHAPTLILHGRRDRSAPYTLAEEMHAGIQGSQLLPFRGGHLFFLIGERQPFLTATTTFLHQ